MIVLTLALVLCQSPEADFLLPVFEHPDAGEALSTPPLESLPMIEPHQSFPQRHDDSQFFKSLGSSGIQ